MDGQRSHSRVATLIAIALAATACQPQITLDTTSIEAVHASVARAREALAPEDLPAIESAVDKLVAAMQSDASREGSVGLNPLALNGLPVVELPAYVARREYRLAETAAVKPAIEWPNLSLAARVLRGVSLERSLLESRRQAAKKSALFTIDQFPIADFVVMPPTDNMRIEDDKARFVASITNNGELEAWTPAFHVLITVEGEGYPRLNREFQLERLADPVMPGETQRVAFSCCSLTEEPFHNAKLRNLPANARVDVSLVSLKDVKNRPLFDTAIFSREQEERLTWLTQCESYLKAHAAEWVPTTLGDPCTPGMAEEGGAEHVPELEPVAVAKPAGSPGTVSEGAP